jgi:hypothetical protein
MHLIVAIALGVFGGLWLFVRWAEWRESRAYWREMRRLTRQIERQERERATADWQSRLAREAAERAHEVATSRARFTPPRTPMSWAMTAYAIGAVAAIPVGYLIFGGH